MSGLTICLIICVLTMISYIVGKIPMGLTAMLSMVAFVLINDTPLFLSLTPWPRGKSPRGHSHVFYFARSE